MTNLTCPLKASIDREPAAFIRSASAYPVKVVAPAKHHCPECASPLLRVWRRPIDRMLGAVAPVHRYRCEKFSCQWQGNFRANAAATESTKDEPVSTWMAAKPLVLMGGGFVAAGLAIAIATPSWWPMDVADSENATVQSATYREVDPPLSQGRTNWKGKSIVSPNPAPGITPQAKPGAAL